MICIGLCWMALAQEPAELSPRLAAPTRDASKEALEKYKKAVSRLPMPPEPDPASGPVSKVNNGRFRAYYIPAELRETPGVRVPGGANPAGAAPRPLLGTAFKSWAHGVVCRLWIDLLQVI